MSLPSRQKKGKHAEYDRIIDFAKYGRDGFLASIPEREIRRTIILPHDSLLPLDYAAVRGHFNIAKALIDFHKKFKLPYQIHSPQNYTPLLAAVRGLIAIIEKDPAELGKLSGRYNFSPHDYTKLIQLLIKEFPEHVAICDAKTLNAIYYLVHALKNVENQIRTAQHQGLSYRSLASDRDILIKVIKIILKHDKSLLDHFDGFPSAAVRAEEFGLSAVIKKILADLHVEEKEETCSFVESQVAMHEAFRRAEAQRKKEEVESKPLTDAIVKEVTTAKSQVTGIDDKWIEVKRANVRGFSIANCVSTPDSQLAQNRYSLGEEEQSATAAKMKHSVRRLKKREQRQHSIDVVKVVDDFLQQAVAINKDAVIQRLERIFEDYLVSDKKFKNSSDQLQACLSIEPHYIRSGFCWFNRTKQLQIVIDEELLRQYFPQQTKFAAGR